MTNANVVSAAEAGIVKKSISDNAVKVVRDLQKAGYQAYLVGGCVRDLILGMKPKDFDVSTSATPEQVKKILRNSRIIGRRFKIVHVRFGYEVIEVATFRASASDRDKVGSHEMTEGEQGQLLRDNVYGSLDEDVMRRDFRANALYYDPVEEEILDFVGGIEDIRSKKLISIGEPSQRFTEDPVRMLRVVRFAAKLGFSMEPEAMQMIEEQGNLLSHVSSARLFEEVLKLFHGGAAFETYLLLRKYGLFRYLFPFTDSGIAHDVIGMPERALQNTDKRVNAGKPVIPAFLFACLLWDPVKADAQILMHDGTPEAQAWRIAMADGLRDQNQYVAVPRRLAEIILDIWNIHFRLVKRNPRMVKGSLNNRRFRAAYDFLLLRVALHEVDEEIGEWWTEIQELEPADRDAMIAELGESHQNDREARHSTGEPDGNSINYNEGNSAGNNKKQARSGQRRGGQGRGGQGRAGQAKKNSGGGQKRGRNRRRGGAAKAGRGGQASGNGNGNASGNGNGNNSGNSRGNWSGNGGNNSGKKSGRRRSKGGRQRQAGTGNTDNRYAEARPKDQYGTFQTAGQGDEAAQKKVKVRRKRRVVDPNASDTDNNPHF